MKSLMEAARGPEQEMPMGEAQPNEKEPISKEENLDVEIGTALMNNLLRSQEGEAALNDAMQAGGQPGATLGLMLSQIIVKIQDKMDETPMPLSPRIWLSQNGVIDQVLGELGVPPEVEDGAKTEIMNQLKLLGQQEKNKQQGGAMPPGDPAMAQQQPPMPPQGMPA